MTRQREFVRPAWVMTIPVVMCALIAACNQAPTPLQSPRIAFAPVELAGIGDLAQGSTSDDTLLIRVTEQDADSILGAAGSFDLVLADSSGGSDHVVFTGSPRLTAPGSLGVTATLTRGSVLTVEVVDSDTFNVEQVTIEGLALSASASAPLGPISLSIANCVGSVAGCAGAELIGPPGTIVGR